ncbi:MAG: hypothetical protein LBQ59_03000 [Candidatus Peribacteria bacterium]|jgi:hypothetical protein|nr:hypothetical protein [Candidatus Peribacteria bacterium]
MLENRVVKRFIYPNWDDKEIDAVFSLKKKYQLPYQVEFKDDIPLKNMNGYWSKSFKEVFEGDADEFFAPYLSWKSKKRSDLFGKIPRYIFGSFYGLSLHIAVLSRVLNHNVSKLILPKDISVEKTDDDVDRFF